MTVLNDELCDSCKDLAIEVMSLFEREKELPGIIELKPILKDGRICFQEATQIDFDRIMQKKIEEKIKSLKKFQNTIEVMLSNDQIRANNRFVDKDGKPIESPDDEILRPSFEHRLLGFLKTLIEYTGTFNFDQKPFDCVYLEFERNSILYEKTYKTHTVLNGFESLVNEIDLGNDIKIKKITNEEDLHEVWKDRDMIGFGMHDQGIGMYGAVYVLEVDYVVHGNVIGSQSRTISNVMLALRLFKEGEIRHYNTCSRPVFNFEGGKTGEHTSDVQLFPGKRYLLETDDAKIFVEFWKSIEPLILKHYFKDGDFLDIAMRRFRYSFERDKNEDKLVDLITALEALYSESSDQLRHKIPLRIAKLFEQEKKKRKTLFKKMQKAYDLRSQIVHGGSYDPSVVNNYIEDLENYVRNSIKIFLFANEYIDNEYTILEIIDLAESELDTLKEDLISRGIVKDVIVNT